MLGFDFDPFEVVFEVENPNSVFWNKIDKHHASLGILLGYGQDNAWFFRWLIKFKKVNNPMGEFIRTLSSKFHEQRIMYPDPQNFRLPVFRNFGLSFEETELIEQYEKERKYIKSLYKGRDEVDIALEWLTR